MGIRSRLLIQSIKYDNKRVIKFTLGFFNILNRLFSYFKKGEPQYLNDALAYAVDNLKYDIAKLLIDAGASFSEDVKRSLQKKLVQAAEQNNSIAVESALKISQLHPKWDKFSKNQGQCLDNALIYAAKNLNVRIIKLLIEGGADVNFPDKKDGKNAIEHVVKKVVILKNSGEFLEDVPILLAQTARLLLEHGSEYKNKKHLNEALLYLKQKGGSDQKMMESLIKAGANPGLLSDRSENLIRNPIYEEVDRPVTNSAEPIYAEIDDLREHSNDPIYEKSESIYTEIGGSGKSLDDSGYLSDVSEENEAQQHEEPIYAQVDPAVVAAKREQREKEYSKLMHDKKSEEVNKYEESGYSSEEEHKRKILKKGTGGVYVCVQGSVQNRINKFEQQNSSTNQNTATPYRQPYTTVSVKDKMDMFTQKSASTNKEIKNQLHTTVPVKKLVNKFEQSSSNLERIARKNPTGSRVR